MRKALLALVVVATVGLAGARADVSYRYEAEFAQYNTGSVITPGNQLSDVKIFLVETVTAAGAANTSRVFADGGIFGAGVMVTRTSGDATFKLTSNVAFTANTAKSPTGFGGVDPADKTTPIPPTMNDRTPSTPTVAGLVVNADRGPLGVANTQLGPNLTAPGGPGTYKYLLGTLNILVGNQNSTFKVANYGLVLATVDQATMDLDFGTQAANGYTGAATPLGGFFSFTVVGAAIPEPSSMALCGLIASGMGYAGYRRRKSATPAA
jgi:hypothetical protein